MIAPFVDANEVSKLQHSGKHVLLVDVRWYLDGRDGKAAFIAGHIPSAVWADLEHDLAAHGAPATEGRHPLPSPEHFAAAMERLGIGDNTTVIAYDDTGGVTAGRLVVMLRMLGREAAVLDGGLAGWRSGLGVGGVTPHPKAPGSFTVMPWPADRLATADEAAEAAARGAAIDARSYDRFTGEVTLVDKRPGHIPGSRSAPALDVLDADGRVRSADDLRAHYEAIGVADAEGLVASCGSGVSACLNVLGMERAGLAAPRLYVGSWSGWSADEARPAELGARD